MMQRFFLFVLALLAAVLCGEASTVTKRVLRIGTWTTSIPPWVQVDTSGAYTGGMMIEFYKEVRLSLYA